MLPSRTLDEFQSLVSAIRYLLGPSGCPWDRQQTLQAMRSDLIEEAYEVVEAIDIGDSHNIEEELGDLFFNVVFLCELAEKEKKVTMDDVLRHVTDKLIRRHPHVFGEGNLSNAEEALKQWEQIKKSEKGKEGRKSALDGIPKQMPTLARACKVLKKMEKAGFKPAYSQEADFANEEQLGAHLAWLVTEAQRKGFNAEHALRSFITDAEGKFRLTGG